MNWYAAHIIVYFKLRDRKQKSFRVWENIHLIRAHDSDEAYAKAEELGRLEAIEDKSLTWGGQPAMAVFAGVRKVALCVDPETRPNDGTEVTYLEYDLKSEQAIRKLVDNEPVSVAIADQFPDDEAGAVAVTNGGSGKKTPQRISN